MLIISLIYFITRIPFLRDYPVFYDSFEYLKIADKINFNNFISLLKSSHQPIHTSYLLTIFLVKYFLFFIKPSSQLVFISFLFGYFSVITWYLFIKQLKSRNFAFFSAFLLMVFPYFFVANTNILYESELLFFQIVTIYLLSKKKFVTAGITFAMAQSIFIGNLILLPLLILFIFLKSKAKIIDTILFIFSFFLTSITSDIIILRSWNLISNKYFMHLYDVISTKQGLLITLLRILRNIVVESQAILSVAGLAFLLLSLTIIFRKKKKEFYIYVFALLIFFTLMQYWHAGFYGRLAIGIICPASVILSQIIKKFKWRALLILLISLSTLYYALAQLQKPPIYLYWNLVKNEKNTALITSDYNRFIYEKNNLILFILKGNNTSDAASFISANLSNGRKVLIDSQALTYPYFQYDGNFYQILSLNKNGIPDIRDTINKYHLKTYKTDKGNKNIYFLQIKP